MSPRQNLNMVNSFFHLKYIIPKSKSWLKLSLAAKGKTIIHLFLLVIFKFCQWEVGTSDLCECFFAKNYHHRLQNLQLKVTLVGFVISFWRMKWSWRATFKGAYRRTRALKLRVSPLSALNPVFSLFSTDVLFSIRITEVTLCLSHLQLT